MRQSDSITAASVPAEKSRVLPRPSRVRVPYDPSLYPATNFWNLISVSVQEDLAVTPSTDSLRGKRVAVIVFSYFPSDPRVFRAARALAGAGAEVDLFCLRKSNEAGLMEPASERVSGVNVTRASTKKSRAGKLVYV